jgi:hypothetical protein
MSIKSVAEQVIPVKPLISPHIRVETANGIYELKRPGGRVGAKSMMILSKMSSIEGMQTIPKKLEDGSFEGNEDPTLVKKMIANNNRLATVKMAEVFEEWAPIVLPVTVVSGPFMYDDMPGEDQLALFMALSQETKIGEDFFRILPADSS